jgi:hypothetical protein
MKSKKVKLIVLLLFCLSFTGVYAQNTLNIKENSNSQTLFSFDSIKKLTFADGYMTVNKTDGNSSTYSLSSIRCLNFIDQVTDVSRINSLESSKIMLYPNPAIEQLQIRFETSKTEKAYLKILNIQGRVFHQQTISCLRGTNLETISVAKLSAGVYICYLQTSDKIESIKFLKH